MVDFGQNADGMVEIVKEISRNRGAADRFDQHRPIETRERVAQVLDQAAAGRVGVGLA